MTLPIQRPHDLTRWDPLEEFERLTRHMDTLFESWPTWATRRMEGAFVPLADLEETEDAYLIDIEVPGVAKADVHVEITDRRLVVTGERKEKERTGILRRTTRVTGRFQFEMMFPGDVDETKVEANLEHGVLALRIPKATTHRRRHIQIT